MKIVIDISEETLKAIKTGRIFLTKALYDAFENGILLKDYCKKCTYTDFYDEEGMHHIYQRR